MLKWAAKACGFKNIIWNSWPDGLPLCWLRTELECGANDDEPWCPIDNDGDAFRLAVDLKIDISFDDDCDAIVSGLDLGLNVVCSGHADHAGVRLAIVRSAARIGKAMT